MAKLHKNNGATSVILRVKIMDSASAVGAGKTGLTEASSGLIIGTIADNEAATTRYRASSTEIETITTLGTFAAPTSGKCRFKEVDATNHPGLYEVQLADARFAVSAAKALIVTLSGASGMAQVDAEVQLEPAPADVRQLLGTAWLTPGTAGTPDVNVKLWNALTTVELPLVPTTAGRKLDVSSGGEAGIDWANVGSPTTSLALTGTTIAATQKVDIETIKTQAVTAAAGVTFPTSIASPTNITAGTITTVTNLTNAPTAGDFTATMKTSIGTAVAASAVASVTGNVGGNVTGSVGSVVGLTASDVGAIKTKTDFLPSATAGAAGGVFIAGSNAATSITTALTANIVGNVTGNLSGSVGSVTGLTASDVGAIRTKTDQLTFTVVNQVDVNVVDWKGATAPAMTGDAFARLGAPAGASVSADVAAVKVDTAAAKLSADHLDDTLELTSDGYVFTAVALQQIPAGSTAPTAIEIADAFLDRDMSTGADSGSPTVRTPRQALRALRNKWANVAGTYTVYKEDDSTSSWTSVIATDPAAVPVTGSDPA